MHTCNARPPNDQDNHATAAERNYERSRRHWRRGLTLGSLCAVSFAAGFATGSGACFFSLVLLVTLAVLLVTAVA